MTKIKAQLNLIGHFLPKLFYSTNTYGLFQIFSGYGNSLIDYDREVNKVGLGIALSR